MISKVRRAHILFNQFREKAIGLPVSLAWQGYGSAIFLELGELHSSKSKPDDEPKPVGHISIMIEWSWRIENARSIAGGSWSTDRMIPNLISRLVGSKVVDIQVHGRLPEIEIFLSNGQRLLSFMTSDGQPSWAILDNTIGQTLCVKRGVLSIETRPS